MVIPSYIHRELPTHPHQLRGICLDLPDAARVRFERIDGIFAQVVDDLEISREGVRVLVVLRRDVGLDGFGHGEITRAPKRDVEDVAALHSCLQGWLSGKLMSGLRISPECEVINIRHYARLNKWGSAFAPQYLGPVEFNIVQWWG